EDAMSALRYAQRTTEALPHAPLAGVTIDDLHVVDPDSDGALNSDQHVSIRRSLEECLEVEDALLGLLRARRQTAMALALEHVSHSASRRVLGPRRGPRRPFCRKCASAVRRGAPAKGAGYPHLS